MYFCFSRNTLLLIKQFLSYYIECNKSRLYTVVNMAPFLCKTKEINNIKHSGTQINEMDWRKG